MFAEEEKKDLETDGLLNTRAQLFRHKLVEDFNLLDSIDDMGRIEAPKYHVEDVMDPEKMNKILIETPHTLVKFQVYSKKGFIPVTEITRRSNRVKNRNRNYPPPDIWAHNVVESTWFQNAMSALILINCIVLGIQAEVNDMTCDACKTLKLILDIFDYFSLLIFVLEIVLKWIYDFWGFWKNGWNIFDFLVTFQSLIPEIINWSTGDSEATSEITVIAGNLRIFRILRSLKMVTRFRQVRLITLAVAKAFQAMLFITVLLFTNAYIFAIVGVIFFDSYSQSQRTDLKYKKSFKTIQDTLATLFQLFTLDHWHEILMDVIKVADPLFSTVYIILWICIGSFIFRNIFVGIMVNNFQSIRNELFHEVKEMEELRNQALKMGRLNEELQRQEGILKKDQKNKDKDDDDEEEEIIGTAWSTDEHSVAKEEGGIPKAESHTETKIPPLVNDKLGKKGSMYQSRAELDEAFSKHVVTNTENGTDWQNMVEDNLNIIANNPIDTAWPRDTLFHYFQLMEVLQDNLYERQELLRLASQSLIRIHDT